MSIGIKLGMKFLRQALKSGQVIGGEAKLTKLTGELAKHPKAITEEIGLSLGSKGKKVADVFERTGAMETLTKKLDEAAQKYPDAVVKYGMKESKNGYGVAKVTVKNGDKVVASEAVSFAKGTEGDIVKLRHSFLDENVSANLSKDSIRLHAKDSITEATVRGNAEKGIKVELGKNGEAMSMQIAKGNSEGTKIVTEYVDGLGYANLETKNGHINAIYDKEKVSEIMKKEFEKDKNLFKRLGKLLNGKDKSAKPAVDVKKAIEEFKTNKKEFEKDKNLFKRLDKSLLGKRQSAKSADDLSAKIMKGSFGSGKTSFTEALEKSGNIKVKNEIALKEYYESLKKVLYNPSTNDAKIKSIKVQVDEIEKLAAKENIGLNKIPDHLKEFIDKFY